MHKYFRKSSPGDAVYGLGLIGAVIYYVTTAATFGAGLLGLIKAFFWPAFLVFHLMQYLKM